MTLPASTFEQRVLTESTRYTYSWGTSGYTPAANATDLLRLSFVSRAARLLRIGVSGVATAATPVNFFLVYRTTSNTGGTATFPSAITHDPRDPSPSSAILLYSVNPAGLGTGTVIRASQYVLAAAATPAVTQPELIWDFGNRSAACPLLTASSQSFCLNFNGASVPAGTVINMWMEWTEDING